MSMDSQFPEINSLCHKSSDDIGSGPDLKDVFFLFLRGCQCFFPQRLKFIWFCIYVEQVQKERLLI